MNNTDTKNLVSIIICTFNRCESLKETLDSLLKQKRNGSFDYEVVLVDNNSTDRTAEYAQRFIKEFDNRLKYIFEEKQGISQARNRGIQEARGDIIVFTDDDVVLSQDWMVQIWTCFHNEGCEAVGGRILPLYPENTPKWIKECADLLAGPIVKHDYGEETKIYERPLMKPFVGANMAFKRDLFRKNGFFRTDIGAGRGTMGDDTELYVRLEKLNKKIYYCGKALVWHPVEKFRMNLRYIAQQKTAFGRYLVLIDDDSLRSDGLVYYFGIPRYAVREVIQAGFKLVLNISDRRKFIRSWNHLFIHLGIILQFRENYKSTRRYEVNFNIIQKVKTMFKCICCYAVYYTGGLHLFIKYVFLRKNKFPAVIINFHSFLPDDNGAIDPGPAVNLSADKFRQTLDFISRYFQVVPLDEVVEHLKSGEKFDKPVAAITVDDGYRDNYETMFPVLKEKQIPATVFLAAGFINTNKKIWIDRLLEALSETKEDNLKVKSENGKVWIFNLNNRHKRYAAYNELSQQLKALSFDERTDRLSDIERKLGYQPSQERTMLTWEEVREMENHNVSFGAHTVMHPILSRMPVEEAKTEILESKQIIEKNLGHVIEHFAFPNGRTQDFTDELGRYCQDIGFNSISSTVPGSNGKTEDRWFLKRVCPCWPISVFAMCVLRAFYKR